MKYEIVDIVQVAWSKQGLNFSGYSPAGDESHNAMRCGSVYANDFVERKDNHSS